MKKLMLLVVFTTVLVACSNEVALNEEEYDVLSQDIKDNIEENVNHRGIYLYEFSQRTPLLVARVSEGSTIELEEVEAGVVGVEVDENTDTEEDELRIFRLTIPNDVHEVKLYIDGLETHFDGVQR